MIEIYEKNIRLETSIVIIKIYSIVNIDKKKKKKKNNNKLKSKQKKNIIRYEETIMII